MYLSPFIQHILHLGQKKMVSQKFKLLDLEIILGEDCKSPMPMSWPKNEPSSRNGIFGLQVKGRSYEALENRLSIFKERLEGSYKIDKWKW